MSSINLLPPEERASLKSVRTGTILALIALVLFAGMGFATIYLRMQIKWETEQLTGYQETMASLDQVRVSTIQLENEVKKLKQALAPLEKQRAAIISELDLHQFLTRITYAASQANVWLRELTLQANGVVPIAGYAVDPYELDRFLSAMAEDPFRVQMGSQGWQVRDGVRLWEFKAEIGLPMEGGAQK